MVKMTRRRRGISRPKRKKNEVKLCKHRPYGYTVGNDEKKKGRLTEVSQYCKFNGKSKDFIASERGKYLRSIAILETGGIGKLMINRYKKYGNF